MLKYSGFKYCPHCNSIKISDVGGNSMLCHECGYEYYQNAASAVAGIIEYDNQILVCKRNREPKIGMLDLPGGFVDFEESLEQALKREVKEELNLEIFDLVYFTSQPNIYKYKNVTYFTCDVFFRCKVNSLDNLKISSEISELLLIKITELDLNKFAFSSFHQVLEKYRRFSAG